MVSARVVLVALLCLVPTAAVAHGPNEHPADPNLHTLPGLKDCSVAFAPELTQETFAQFVREFGSVSAFKTSLPTTLGRHGYALGLQQFYFTVEEKSATWNDTFAHPDSYHELGSSHAFPKLTLSYGVTDKLDVGAFYTVNAEANYGWFGLDAEYGLLRQDESSPVSLAIRGAYTKTLFVDDMDMHALSADVSAGRTFWEVLTPYLGLGGDLVFARETSSNVDLQAELQLVPRALGGLELRLGYVSIGAEAHVSEITSYQVHLAMAHPGH